MANDIRYALRTSAKNPGFTAIAIATLALGIGANTAIFSVVDGVLLKPLEFREPGRLVAIHEAVPKFSKIAPRVPVNAMHFLEWRRSVHAFEGLAMIGGSTLNLTGTGEPERLNGARVSSSLFPMLGVQAALGRTFREEEDQPGRDRVVVLSDGLWRRRFAADPTVIGRKIDLDGKPYEIVGVLPKSFHFPKLSQLYAMDIASERPELWKPFAVSKDELSDMGDFNYVGIGRLKPGVTLARALAELDSVQARLGMRAEEKVELKAVLVPLREQITSRSRSGLELLSMAVGAILLIACVNIANLLLARATGRRREMAIRAAVGASAGRLARQTLTESLMLALAGGVMGVALAGAGLKAILAYAPAGLARLDEVHLDGRVLWFSLGVSTLAGLVFGLLPAWRISRSDPQEAMQAGARGSTQGRGSGRLHSLLVSVEVGLSAVCLIAAGLLLDSFVKVMGADKGFAADRVVTVELNMPAARYPNLEARTEFLRTLIDRVRPLPGVVAAGVSNMLPLAGEGGNNLITIDGTNMPLMERPIADIRGVNPDYFRTMGIAPRAGRIFEEADRTRKIALVSAITAARFWPGENAVGKRFRIGDPSSEAVEVVGVVGDVRGVSLDRAPTITVYIPFWQRRSWGQDALAVRTAGDPVALAPAIRTAIRGIDPQMAIPGFKTMRELVDESVSQRRFQMNLVLLFAATAMMLACLGIYGVVSYAVARRRNELGIRMALGARAGDVGWMVVRQGMTPVAIGLAAGLVVSLALGKLLAGLLYGVGAVDGVVMGAVALTLGAVALAASYLPARRAAKIDPMTALRYE